MKKSIIMGIIIFLCIIALAIVTAILVTNISMSKGNNDMLDDIYDKYSTDVDGAVQELMSSEEYNKMSKDSKVNTMGDLLNIYQENHIIKNLYYDEFGPSYTFTYNHGDIKGALGGVLLKDWNPMMN